MSVNYRDPITGVLTQLAGNGAPTDVGTAAFKDFTDVVRAGDHRLVEANAVANAIDQGLSSIYTPRGDITCAELTSDLLIEANIGNVYETSDAGTTSDLFIQGADHPITKGDNVGIIKAGQNDIMFNLMGNAFDLHDYQKKDLESAIEGATTVEGALGALSSGKVSTELVPSDASASNQLVTADETHDLQLFINGATYATTTDFINKLASEINAIKPNTSRTYGGTISGEWTGKTYFIGTYTVNNTGAGIAQIKCENAQSGKDVCVFVMSSGSPAVVSWQKLVTDSDLTSSVTSGSTAPITSGGVYDAIINKANQSYSYGGQGKTIKVTIWRDGSALLILYDIYNGITTTYLLWASNDLAGVTRLTGAAISGITEGIILHGQGSASELSITIPTEYCYKCYGHDGIS